MGESTAEVRRDIEERRAQLSGTIDAIAERTSPSRMAERQRQRVADRFRSLRETIMGTAEGAGGSVQETAGAAAETARQAPDVIRNQTQGNPLAAGLIAFGSGLLAGSLLPSTRPERQAASRLLEQAEPALQQAQEAGREAAGEITSSARDAASRVTESASEAGQRVVEDAKDSARQVKEQASGAAREAAGPSKPSTSTEPGTTGAR
jgi:uncharacterized protein YjbJ (UPF0337 family)